MLNYIDQNCAKTLVILLHFWVKYYLYEKGLHFEAALLHFLESWKKSKMGEKLQINLSKD